MSQFKSILENHFKVLTEYGCAAAFVIEKCDDVASILKLNTLKKVNLPDDLVFYFEFVNGYDRVKKREHDEMPIDIAYGRHAMDVELCYNDTANNAGASGEEDTYWPLGFVPILYNYGGDYIMINCIKESPTYGAVYDFTEGIGVNLLSNSLSHFFECSTNEITTGFRVFIHDDDDYEFQSIVTKGVDEMAKIYSYTPYFKRDVEQLIDWV